ncbi:hypothetical protein CDL12_16246 [Handroanthus impetiginosus]|uniref:Uncharacterized protein n=1 Tax=Handroanthus impetiginosus TaxID=429701 RepID=A0A2G9H0W0_9LAMI|nr:hypothetical protein CDL12_16246 [Handroanthus impetiginosus]
MKLAVTFPFCGWGMDLKLCKKNNDYNFMEHCSPWVCLTLAVGPEIGYILCSRDKRQST